MLGAAQAGRQLEPRLLALLSDEELIAQAREEATALVEADPDLGGATRRSRPAIGCAARRGAGRVPGEDMMRRCGGSGR